MESLAYKQVTQVSVGLDFMLALGMDYDQFGRTVAGQIQMPKMVSEVT